MIYSVESIHIKFSSVFFGRSHQASFLWWGWHMKKQLDRRCCLGVSGLFWSICYWNKYIHLTCKFRIILPESCALLWLVLRRLWLGRCMGKGINMSYYDMWMFLFFWSGGKIWESLVHSGVISGEISIIFSFGKESKKKLAEEMDVPLLGQIPIRYSISARAASNGTCCLRYNTVIGRISSSWLPV